MKSVFFAFLTQTGKYIGAGLAVIGCAGARAGILNILIIKKKEWKKCIIFICI